MSAGKDGTIGTFRLNSLHVTDLRSPAHRADDVRAFPDLVVQLDRGQGSTAILRAVRLLCAALHRRFAGHVRRVEVHEKASGAALNRTRVCIRTFSDRGFSLLFQLGTGRRCGRQIGCADLHLSILDAAVCTRRAR